MFSIQTSTLYDRPTTRGSLWWQQPQFGCRDLCMTALWARLHAKTSVSHLNIIPHSWLQSPTRPLITPVHRAKNNSRGSNLACCKIKMRLWLQTCLQLSMCNHCNQNKQRCEADVKAELSDPAFTSPVALFSIIQSQLIGIFSALFPVSCLDIWPAAVNHYNYSECCWECIGKAWRGWEQEKGEMADSMTEMRKRMILLLPGKVQQTNPWKKMLFTLTDLNLFFLPFVRNTSRTIR